jgi:23S rRNA (guanine2445-N2)-methyltransferase
MAGKPKSGTLSLGTKPSPRNSKGRIRPTLAALRRGHPDLHRGRKDTEERPAGTEAAQKSVRDKRTRPETQHQAGYPKPREGERPHQGGEPRPIGEGAAGHADAATARLARRGVSESGETQAPDRERSHTGRRPRSTVPQVQSCFATCQRGLEKLLAAELSGLGADEAEVTAGGVGFKGDWPLVYRANMHSRLATRILLRVTTGKYTSEEDIYRGTLAVYWERWFDASRTIAVKVVAQNSPLKSLNFVTLKIKDAICDRFREETGQRPSVQTVEPDIRVRAFLTRDRFTLYLDTSGEALHKRGLRKQAGLAPINENLAAGILKLSGWEPGQVLFDPMCGSGTFLMEAALMSLNRAPGLGRNFAFEKFSRLDAGAWNQIREQAKRDCKPIAQLPIYGSDVLGHSLRDADANLKAAGLREAVTLSKADILDIEAVAETGVMVMNPPYGVRLGDEAELAEMYPKLGDVLKQRFPGWRIYIISADPNLPRLMRLDASKKTPLFNGALECRLYEYKLVRGSNRK